MSAVVTITGPDVSHHQGTVDFAAVARANAFAVLKATEGVGYTDPLFAANRAKAHAAGLVVGLYHFARAGDPAAEAAYFLRTVGTLQPGEFLVLDWEVPGANPPAWCLAWLNAVRAATGVKPLVYMNSTAVNGSNWSPVIAADYGLWLAKYDDQSQTAVPYWGAPAMKQFTDRATVPGVAGPCDLNVFYGSRAQLLAYCKGGPTPAPTPGGLTLANVSDTDAARLVASMDLLVQQLMGPGYTVGQTTAAPGWPGRRYGSDVSQTVVDMLRSIDRQTGSLLDLEGRPLPVGTVDNELGHVLSLRAEVAELAAKVDAMASPTDSAGLAAQLAATQAAVAQLSTALTALAGQHPTT